MKNLQITKIVKLRGSSFALGESGGPIRKGKAYMLLKNAGIL